MKNPCEDNCLIVAACTHLCPQKINYGNLVTGAVRRHREYVSKIDITDRRKFQRILKMAKLYEKKSIIHSQDVTKVHHRSKGQL
jgi:hypothetical protein